MSSTWSHSASTATCLKCIVRWLFYGFMIYYTSDLPAIFSLKWVKKKKGYRMLWSCMHLQAADKIACIYVMFERLVQDRKYLMLGQCSKCLLFYHNWGSSIKTLQVSALPTKVFSGIVDIHHPPLNTGIYQASTVTIILKKYWKTILPIFTVLTTVVL